MKLKQSSKKALAITSALLVVFIGGVYAYQRSTDSQINLPGKESLQDSNAKQNAPESAAPTNTENGKDTPKQYEGDLPNSKSSITGVINYKSVIDGVLQIRVTIDQSISSGTCTLKLSRVSSDMVVTRQANTVSNPSSSTCEGFSVPVSELGQGEWDISVNVEGDSKTGVIKDTVVI